VANTQSAKKAIRSSERKRQHNLFWKRRINTATKNIKRLLKEGKADGKLLEENLVVLQKVVDKAAKEKVIHKNKANRLKSRYTKKVSAHGTKAKTTKSGAKKAGTKPKASTPSKQKS
jgi:small subunit ribosomal protein S20